MLTYLSIVVDNVHSLMATISASESASELDELNMCNGF